MKDHGLLVEKYRPTSLDKFIGDYDLKQKIQSFIDKGDITNMLFHGPAGSGKTTLSKLIVKNIDCDYLMINASDERGIETIRDKVVSFASSASFKPIKIIILDEADYLTVNAQASLRNVIESFSRNTRFILTCNFLERIIDPIQSRCSPIRVVPPSKKDMAKHLVEILDNEKIEYDDDLGVLFNKFFPDFRKILNNIQFNLIDNQYTGNKLLKLNSETLSSGKYVNEIIDELQTEKPDWKKIRKIIANSGQSSFEEVFRALYVHISKIIPKNEAIGIMAINEHQYQAQFAIDKEINLMSLVSQIIQNK